MKKLILSLSFLCCCNVIAEESLVWKVLPSNTNSSKTLYSKTNFSKPIMRKKSYLLDGSLLRKQLKNDDSDSRDVRNRLAAKRHVLSEKATSEKMIKLPLPNGDLIEVSAKKSQVISKKMQESYPHLQTWKVKGVKNPKIHGVIDFTDNGFHGMLIMPDGDMVFIDPDKNQTTERYTSFSKRQNGDSFDDHIDCDVHERHTPDTLFSHRTFGIKEASSRSLDDTAFPNFSISDIKTYRLALSATAEYTANRGGTAAARSSMVTTVNRINPIFERDLGVKLELIDAPELIFTDEATDPFSNPDSASTLMRENGDYLFDGGRMGDFDIGHVFSHRSQAGGSGVAYVGVSCIDQALDSNSNIIKGAKAAGATTSSSPFGETFDLVLVAHELGHQLGANHSFNSSMGNNCANGRTAAVAVEPGSGSSIMSYNGLCGSDNLPEDPRDDYFHFASITQIINNSRQGTGANCGVVDANSINAATADAGVDFQIPANTPFILNGTSSGGTSSWDQIDIGASSNVDVDNGDNPIVRHIIPTTESDRYVPSLKDLFANTKSIGEIVPSTSRELNFAYVVRDEGFASDKMRINVTDTNESFTVQSHDTDQTITTNRQSDFIWNTASTESSPINCTNVDIQLISENGTKNMLLASTANDGRETVTIPNTTPELTGARVFIACSDSSFFNISAGNIDVVKGDSPVGMDTENPILTLNGNAIININLGDVYIDQGATAVDNVDDNLTIKTTGSVNSSVAGAYTIRYTATDSSGNTGSVTRTVNVVPPADTVPPIIILNGLAVIELEEGSRYIEPGYSAMDDRDGVVAVIVSGAENVDTNTEGEYLIVYTASDAANNSSSKTRKVIVTKTASAPTQLSAKESGGGGNFFGQLILVLFVIGVVRRKRLVKKV